MFPVAQLYDRRTRCVKQQQTLWIEQHRFATHFVNLRAGFGDQSWSKMLCQRLLTYWLIVHGLFLLLLSLSFSSRKGIIEQGSRVCCHMPASWHQALPTADHT